MSLESNLLNEKINDIEKELVYYKDYLKGKIVYCNCDKQESNFVKFLNNVKISWGIREVLHTSIQEGYSFDSDYSIDLLKKCDIVITNPPFSLFREFVSTLIEYKKDLRIDKSTISKAKKITRLNFESILYQYKQIQQIKY